MRKVFSISFWTCLIAITLAGSIFAQETTGGIEGQVKDPAGALVPNVTITVTARPVAGRGTLGRGWTGLEMASLRDEADSVPAASPTLHHLTGPDRPAHRSGGRPVPFRHGCQDLPGPRRQRQRGLDGSVR